jgi:DNA gyrase/topoisomerase IV subunit B
MRSRRRAATRRGDTRAAQLVMKFFEENPKEAKAAIMRADRAARARAAARQPTASGVVEIRQSSSALYLSTPADSRPEVRHSILRSCTLFARTIG